MTIAGDAHSELRDRSVERPVAEITESRSFALPLADTPPHNPRSINHK